MSEANGNDGRLEFRGGPLMSVLPIAVFLVWTVYLVVRGAVVEQGMIIAAMAGIALGMVFVRDPAAYSERVFSLMANRIATVAVVCWIWAGAFSSILADSGLVQAMIWLGWKAGLSGAAFTLAVFISASLFAVTVGTGLGTVVGFTSVMYPAGIVLGAHPGALMGAILSGAAFGDNLAPVSDTTIVSAATQETDVGGVVRSRLKYSLTAGVVAAIILYFLGGGGHSGADSAAALELLERTADPKALPMLIPAALVFVFAVSGFHFLFALNIGIVSALVIGPVFGVFPLERVFHITADNSVAGSAVSGAMAMLPVSVLTLLLVTSNGVMEAGGFLDRVVRALQAGIARTVRGTEAAVVILISLANFFVPVNTIAMVAVGPLAARLSKPKGIHPYRIANLLDTISCSFPFLLPYSAVIIAAMAIQRELAQTYSFVPVLSWAQMAPYIFYSMALFVVMILAVVTGFGRKRG